VTRVRAVEEDDRLVAAVVRRIGDPAAELRDDADTSLTAVADVLGDGPAVAGLLARRAGRWELRTTPEGDAGEVVTALVTVAADHGGGPLSWFVPEATDDDHRAAARSGLARTRGLFQMRCRLPLDDRATVAVRSYRPDHDRSSWLEVNNRAFRGHPDQGRWTVADLRAREAEPWFDPDGFLLHEIDGRLAAFCWTKVHVGHDPPLGEIYVIGVDPDFQGRGLGRELTRAGLDHLTERGLEVGMLYVEDDQETAVGLYRDLGFHIHHEDVFFTRVVAPA
jgi:mycothiol synthase